MSEGKRPRSIWKRYEKTKVEAKKEDSEKLYYRINRKSGRVETNVLGDLPLTASQFGPG